MTDFTHVSAWMKAAKQTSSAKTASLYVGLILEEVREMLVTIDRAGDKKYTPPELGSLMKALQFGSEMFRFTNAYEENMKALLVDKELRMAFCDDLMDIKWVVNGEVVSVKIRGDLAWTELASSNYSKFDPKTGKATLDESGKVVKPPTFRKPDFSKCV